MKITFCGHREILGDENLSARMEQCLRIQLSAGGTDFFFGGYGAFQVLAYHKVSVLQKQYPFVHTALVLPYLTENRKCFGNCQSGYDEIIYPPLEAVPKRLAILKRDEWLVEQCDLIIAYVSHEWGGAARMLEYARRKKKHIISLVK